MDEHTPRALSWIRQWRRRSCPPEQVLHGNTSKPLREHLALCPWCRQDFSHGPTGFLPLDLPQKMESAVPPQPGELWSIAPRLAGWGPKNRYYVPPLVLIVAVFPDAVTVVQTCGETAFAATDDVPFPNVMHGFAQPWNRYTLRKEDLGIPFGPVFSALPPALLDPAQYQSIQLAPGSLLWFFRQMEVESGYYFSSQAVAALMAEYGQDRKRPQDILHQLVSMSPADLHRRLSDLGLQFPATLSECTDSLAVLAMARLADDALPLAAADGTTPAEFAINVILRDGSVTAAKPLAMHIDHWEQTGELLHVSGRLGKKVRGKSQPLIWLQTLDRRIDPLPGEFGLDGDFFWALYNVGDAPLENGECLVRIVSTS